MTVGDRVRRSGFITQAKFLRSQSSLEIERRLGYRTGRMAQGWTLLFLLDRLTEADFEFRGYSQMSGGVSQGHLPMPPDRRNAEEFLKEEGYDVPRLKRDVITTVFKYSGSDRLCKVIPTAGEFGENDYPPGSGIPQWTILKNREKWFQVAAVIGPNETYLGDYS